MNEEKIHIEKKKQHKKNKNIIQLTKIILCIAVISAISVIGINKWMENAESVSVNVTEVKPIEAEDSNLFGGVPLINDNRGVPVICYHSITDDPKIKNPIVIYKEKLREHLQALKDNGYTTLTMAQLNDYLFKDKPIPEKSVVITFDDGYKDNYVNAFPILKELNINATIFVIQSYVNQDPYLTADEIKEMSSYGIDIESHTVSHRRLSELSYEDQLKELKDSKEKLEKLINKPIISIAYPEGKYNEDTKKAFSEVGYSMGFTTERGYADRDDNKAELNRIVVDYTYKPKDILKVLKNIKK